MTTYYTSNDPTIGFDATTAGTLPGNWANKAGTWLVGTTNPVGSHTRSFISNTGLDGDVALVTGVAAVADMQVAYTQVLPGGVGSSAQPIMSPVLRCDSSYNTCYTCVIGVASTGHINYSLYRRVGGAYAAVGTGASPQTFATSGSITLNVVAQIVGTSFTIKAWQGGTTMPTSWDWTTTDGAVTAAGYAGVYNALNAASGARAVDDFLVSDTGGAAETILVTTPGTEIPGNSYTYTGTYTGTQPVSLDYQFDAAGWVAASATISGGAWSFTATAPAAGTHTLSVRDHVITSISGTSGSFTTSGSSETISVTTPGSETAGNGYTYSGSYTGGPPTALDFQFDSAGWTAAPSPTIGGGTWSFAGIAPAAGTHTLSVRDHTNTTASGTSGSFTTTAGGAISIVSPSGLIIDGQTLTVSGAYTGTVPTGLNYRIDSGSYVAASAPTIAAGAWSFAITAPAFGSHTLTVQEANATSATATSSAFTVSSAPNNAAMLYSPYNWNIGGGAAITVNAGAYFRTLFGSSTTCVLNFDVTGMVSPTSEIWSRIDNGAWVQAAVNTPVSLHIPAITLSNADVPYHLLEVVVKSTTETQNRWNAGNSTRVLFKGLTLDAGATLLAPLAAPKRLLIYGDSITEGVRTLGEVATNDTDRNDAMMGWAYRLGALLGAEVGVVGFGASGLSVTGSGNVPVLGSSYSLLYAGASRSFSPAPDMVVFNEGTNDGGNNIVAAMTAVLNAVIAACPAAVIAVLRPFNGNQASNLQAAIAACSNPAACHYVDTTGFFNTAYGADTANLHPSGPNDLGLIAPQIAGLLRPLLSPAGGTTTVLSFRGGFQRGLLG